MLTTIPNVLLIRANLPIANAPEFLDYVRQNPGRLNYASQGNGTTSHLTAELFQNLTKTKLVHVPYRGTGPALNDLVAGHVDLMFVEAAVAIQQHNAGKARILAVAASKRLDALPDIPTFAEAGLTGFESGTWNAIAAPPGTPRDVTALLNRAVNEVLAQPEIRAQFLSLNMQPIGGTPEEMAKLVREETKRWGDVIVSSNVTIN